MKNKKKFDGKRGGYDYRCGNVAGCYNLWKNGKYVKSVDVETFVNLKKDDWYFEWYRNVGSPISKA